MAGVKDEKFLYEDSLKNSIFRGRGGGAHEKGIYKGQLPKKGGLGQFFNLRGDLAKKWGVFSLLHVYYAHFTSLKFEQSVCHESLMTTYVMLLA